MGKGQVGGVIDSSRLVLYRPPKCGSAKRQLYERVGVYMAKITTSIDELAELSREYVPAIGSSPELRPLIQGWRESRRPWVYWDRGYMRRIFTAWLPKGEDGGYYRWHLGCFQMRRIREVNGDRFKALDIPVAAWKREGGKIVVAPSLPDYDVFHGCVGWIDETVQQLQRLTTRQIVVRHRDSDVPLYEELADAHCLVTHGSNAANEAVIMGCPVFVLGDCAARHVGLTDLTKIEEPIYPERGPWLQSLAYSQVTEAEIASGTAWSIVE